MIGLLLISFIPETEANPYAVAGHGRWWPDSIRSLGAKWVRMWRGDGGVVWGDIQPTSLDSFKWDKQDSWIRWADSCGFNIMLTVTTGGPGWARPMDYCKWIDSTRIPAVDSLGRDWTKASFPPRDYNEWYNFVYAVASRYDGNTPDPLRPGKFLPEVRYWEVVPEPDHWNFWYGTKETYFDLFVPTFVRAVKDANPNAVIVGPSMTSYSTAWALIQEMVDSGVDTATIVNFHNSHIKYTAAWHVNWKDIQSLLDTGYKVRWQINFVKYAYQHAWLYDKWGFHDYENWETSPILRDYDRRHLAIYGYEKPFWWTELGHDNRRVWQNIPQTEGAARTWKKIINAHYSGVEWMSYAPMLPVWLDPFAIPLYRYGFLSIVPREAKFSFAFIASKINEQTGFRFSESDTLSRSYLFWFRSDNLPDYTLLSAWADSGITDTIKVSVLPGTQSVTLYDYLGNPTSLSFSDSVTLILTWQPVMVEFYHTTGASEGLAKKGFTATPIPNPGKGGVGLSLSLPVESDVILRLYDPTGRLALTREMGKLRPGEHRVFLPAKPGVYFLEAEAGGYRRVIKVVAK